MIQMPIKIEGTAYFFVADIQRDVAVARQTLWRWRRAQKIPQGRRYRDRQVVFTKEEVETIRDYANRLEPLKPSKPIQSRVSMPSSPKRRVR
jgi:hypothetical protein